MDPDRLRDEARWLLRELVRAIVGCNVCEHGAALEVLLDEIRGPRFGPAHQAILGQGQERVELTGRGDADLRTGQELTPLALREIPFQCLDGDWPLGRVSVCFLGRSRGVRGGRSGFRTGRQFFLTRRKLCLRRAIRWLLRGGPWALFRNRPASENASTEDRNQQNGRCKERNRGTRLLGTFRHGPTSYARAEVHTFDACQSREHAVHTRRVARDGPEHAHVGPE